MTKVATFGVLHLFCGIGGAALGMQESEAEWKGIRGNFYTLAGIDSDPDACRDFEMLTGAPAVQMDLFSREDYISFHGCEPPEDWREATPEDLHRAIGGIAPDVLFTSPPCLPGQAEVLTSGGPQKIETIRTGDMVLTHRGRYRRVLKVGTHNYKGDMVRIRLNGTVDYQEFTCEHPLWRRKVIRNTKTGHRRQLGNAEFVRADQVSVGDRIGFPIDQEIKGTAQQFINDLGEPQIVERGGRNIGCRYAKKFHELTDDRIIDLRLMANESALWFLVGVYLGDGYRRKKRYESIFCVGSSDGDLALRCRKAVKQLGFSWYEDTNGGHDNIKIRVPGRHLWNLLGQFGDGADEKFIPAALMNLEGPFVQAIIDGYRSSDGSEQGRRVARNELQARWEIASISLQLLKDLQRLLLRMGQFGSIHNCWPGGPQTIMGRTVQTKRRYELNVRLDPIKRTVYEFKDGAIWVRVRRAERRSADEAVWNLEVDEDNTFCVHLIATHNCKGFSGLLPTKSAKSEKYQALNRLTVRGLRLALEAFTDDLPGIILLENVPRITSRGSALLDEIKQLLGAHGYLFHEGNHCCGEIGGLGQRRKRYLLIARLPSKVTSFVYHPPELPLQSIGDVIGPMPMPDDPTAGPMHRLPRLQWKTWVRLALIPAGGDWRALEKIAPRQYRLEYLPRGGGSFGVQEWGAPSGTVTGNAKVNGSNAANIADPRTGFKEGTHGTVYRVSKYDEPARTVTGAHRPNNGAPSIADPRLGCKCRSGSYGVQRWDKPGKTVTGSGDIHSGAAAVADPRGPKDTEQGTWVIIALDGTWHRPLTTLELAALQGFPAIMSDGSPLQLTGKSDAKWRERIGNAVPPPAAKAIGDQILMALVPSIDKSWVLGATPVWVQHVEVS